MTDPTKITAPHGFCPFCGSVDVRIDTDTSARQDLESLAFSDYKNFKCGECELTWRNISNTRLDMTE